MIRMKLKNWRMFLSIVLDSIDRQELVLVFLLNLIQVVLIILKLQIWVIQDIVSLDLWVMANTNNYSDLKSSSIHSTSPTNVVLMLTHHILLLIMNIRYRMMILLSWHLMACTTTSLMTMWCIALSKNPGKSKKHLIP